MAFSVLPPSCLRPVSVLPPSCLRPASVLSPSCLRPASVLPPSCLHPQHTGRLTHIHLLGNNTTTGGVMAHIDNKRYISNCSFSLSLSVPLLALYLAPCSARLRGRGVRYTLGTWRRGGPSQRSYRLLRPPSAHSLTHSLTHSPTHSLTHSLTHPLTHSVTQSITPFPSLLLYIPPWFRRLSAGLHGASWPRSISGGLSQALPPTVALITTLRWPAVVAGGRDGQIRFTGHPRRHRKTWLHQRWYGQRWRHQIARALVGLRAPPRLVGLKGRQRSFRSLFSSPQHDV